MMIALLRQVAGREKQRTLQVKATPGTCVTGRVPKKGCAHCFPLLGGAGVLGTNGSKGWVRVLQISPWGAASPETPIPLLRGMKNGHLTSLLFSRQMRCESPTGEEPGAWACGCLEGSLIR